MKREQSYRAVIERDPDGYWFADFPDVPGCHTQAKTLSTLRARMRQALSLFVDAADRAEILEDLRLDATVRELIQDSHGLREAAAALQAEAAGVTAEAAEELVRLGLPLRDTGELLGLSHQRVQQLVRRRSRPARGANQAK